MRAGRTLAKAAVVTWAMLAAACGGTAPPAAETSVPATPRVMTADERVQWYRDCWELFNNQNWEPFKACYADGVVSEEIDGGRPPARGPEAVIASVREYTAGFPDLEGAGQLILQNGDRIAGLYLLIGTHTGPLPGPDGTAIPPTNRKVGYMLAHVLDTNAEGGKAVVERTYVDAHTMLAQLGLSPAPARAVMDSGAATPTIVQAGGTDLEASNVAAGRAQMELFNARDLKGTDGYNDPAAVFHDYTQPMDIDAKANSAMLAGFVKAFPDCRLSATTTWGAGDYVVIEGVFQGTNTGTYAPMGINKATGKPVQVRFIEIARYENGKIKEDWLLFNSLAFAGQLGLAGS